jgi:hypothetical protein
MGRSFRTRYESHIRDIRYNRHKSWYALHILHHKHDYGPIDEIWK